MKEYTTGLLVAALVLSATSGGVLASAPPTTESTTFEIDTMRLCVYGNWIEGTVQIELLEDEVRVEGARVFPARSSHSAPSHEAEALNPRDQLTEHMYALQLELATSGTPQEEIVERCISFLEDDELVEQVELLSGFAYGVTCADGDYVVVNIGHDIVAAYEAMIQVHRGQSAKAQGYYDRLTKWLGLDRTVLVGTDALVVLPDGSNSSEAFAGEVERATRAVGPITEESWGEFEFIPPAFAEMIRAPLSLDAARGEGRE